MKTVSQLIVGLLAASGSILLVLAAASLALLEGGALPVALVSTATQPAVIATVSPVPGGLTATVAPQATATPTITPTSILPCADKPKDWVAYTVQGGDTIASLIEQSGVSPEEFLKANCLRSTSTPLEPGWVVYMPPAAAPTETATATQTQSPEPPLPTVCGAPYGWIIYIVQPGDNLFRISLAYGISQQELMMANCLTSTWIYAGQRLYVPNRPTITPNVTRTATVTVTPVPPTETVPPTVTHTPTTTRTPQGKQDQTITFAPLADKTFGDPPFTVSATASSGLAVSFSASGGCTISGNTVTLTGAGSCSVTAAQPGNGSYNPAQPVTQSFQIAKASQTIDFGALPDKTFGDPPFAVSATASSGLPVSFSASGSCSIAGNVVTLSAIGSCAITASQGGDSNHLAAAPVTQSFQVAKASQTIDFGALPDRTFGDPPFAVSASASSGLPVSFSASGSCTIAGNTVTMTAAGTCTITASQDGNGSYSAATPVSRSFQVNQPN